MYVFFFIINYMALVIILLITLIWILIIFKKIFDSKLLSKHSNLNYEQSLLHQINSSTINDKNVNLYTNEKVLIKIENVKVYTFTKVQNVSKTTYVSNQWGLFKLISFGKSLSVRQSLFQNTLRYFGMSLCLITNLNIYIYTTNGHYSLKLRNIVYLEFLNKNKLLIIEKNKKSLLFISNNNQLLLISKLWKQIQKVPSDNVVNNLILSNWRSYLQTIKNQNLTYTKIYHKGKIIQTKKMTCKKVIELILFYLIEDGIYLTTCNNLLSQNKLVNKNNQSLKQQVKVGIYYLNTSNNLKSLQRVTMFCEILEKSEINLKDFVIEIE